MTTAVTPSSAANYGQGSSREHAALAPRCLGLRAVLVKSFARIHLQNLINYGVLPLVFETADDFDRPEQDGEIMIRGVRRALQDGGALKIETGDGGEIAFLNDFSERQREILLAGGIINWRRSGDRA